MASVIEDAAAIAPWVGLIGGTSGFLALYLSFKKDRRESYDQYFSQLEVERSILERQLKRAPKSGKDAARASLRAKEDEIIEQSEAYRASLTLRRTGPRSARIQNDQPSITPEIERFFDVAEGVDPALLSPEDLFIRGNILLELGRPDEAEDSYRRAIEVGGDDAGTWNNLAIALNVQRKDLDGLAAAIRATELDPESPAGYANQAQALNNLGRFDDALPVIARALELEPGSPLLLVYRGTALARLGRFEEAQAALDMASHVAPASRDVLHALADLNRERGDEEAALRFMDAAIQVAPLDVHLWVDKSEYEWHRGARDAAARSAARALELGPDSPEAWRAVGAALVRDGHHRDAIPHLRRYLETKPDDVFALRAIGEALGLEGPNEAFIAYQSRLVGLSPDDPILWMNLAVGLRDAGRLDDALDAINHSLELRPDADVRQSLVGLLLERRGSAAAREAVDGFGPLEDREAKRLNALIYRHDGDRDNAIELLREVISDGPPNALDQYNLACDLAVRGDLTDAKEPFFDSLDLDPGLIGLAKADDDLTALLALPDVRERLGDYESDG